MSHDVRDGPVEQLSSQLVGVLRRYPDVAVAYLFGSHARGESRPGSDVDVAVLFGDVPSVARRMELRADLAQAIAPRELDLVELDDAPVTLAHRVLRHGIVLAGADDPRRRRHLVSVLDRYFDMAPMRRTLDAGTRHRLEGHRYGRR